MSLIERFDALDNRREIVVLLGKLTPLNRFRFLAWSCEKSTLGAAGASYFRMREKIDAATRGDDAADMSLTLEIYGDLIALDLQYDVPIGITAVALEEFVKRPRAFVGRAVAASPRSPGGAHTLGSWGISRLVDSRL